MSEWESTKGSGNTWNPTKDENGNPLSEAKPTDYKDGYYVNKKEGVGQHSATVHTLETEEGEKIDIWGTTSLNQELDKIRLGQFIRVQWRGKKLTKSGEIKKASGKHLATTDSFHDWEVFVNRSKEPLKFNNSTSVPSPKAQEQVDAKPSGAMATGAGASFESEAKPRAAVQIPTPGDDLPF